MKKEIQKIEIQVEKFSEEIQSFYNQIKNDETANCFFSDEIIRLKLAIENLNHKLKRGKNMK